MAAALSLFLVAVASSSDDPHPALGALGMGGDLTGRGRGSRARATRTVSTTAPASDQCDPHAVMMTAVAKDPTEPIVVNSTVYAQFAWSPAAAARAPPLPTDWIGLYCSRSAVALRAMSSMSIVRWNELNITYKSILDGAHQKDLVAGSVGFTIPAINAWGWGGICEFRYHTHRDGTPYCFSSTQLKPFIVADTYEDTTMPVSLVADRASVRVGDTLHMQYSWRGVGAAAATDWVGIYCATDALALLDVANNAICEVGCTSWWQYVDVDPTWSPERGSIPIAVPPSRYGACELRYFNRADGTAYDQQGVSSNTFNITNAGPQWGEVDLTVRSASSGGTIPLGAGLEVAWKWRDSANIAAHAADVIAFYCGDATDTEAADTSAFGGNGLNSTPDHKYLDYALASALDEKQWHTGSGNFSRPLGSTARLPRCEFRMFRAESTVLGPHGGAENAADGTWIGPLSLMSWLGSSPPFEVGGHGGPQQVHLALTSRRDEMRVHWTSSFVLAGGVTWVSATTGNGGTTAGSVPRTYAAADMCNAPANDPHDFHDPGMLHEAVMTGLEAGVRYNYSVGDDKTGWSPTRSFVAALPAVQKNSTFEPFTYIVYADMGVGVPGRWGQCPNTFGDAPGCYGATDVGPHAIKVLVEHEVKTNAARMVHHIGDVSYAVGNSATWEAFFPLIEPIAAHAPYMVGIGNHEMCHAGGGSRDPSVPADAGAVNAAGAGYCAGVYTDDSGGECGVPMNARFTMPDNGNAVWWYSFDFSAVKTIMLSSEHDVSPGSAQHKWLAAQLNAVDRDVTPWVILELHRPMYNNEDYGADYATGIRIRGHLEPLLLEHSVDLVLAGHYHSYMRTSRIANDTVSTPGTPGIYHFTIGSAGGILDNANGNSTYGKAWQLHFEEAFGYGRITIANRTHMLWEFIRASDSNVSAATPTPYVGDSTWIIKEG